MSRCSGQLGLQNVTVAECPALSLFMETLCLIDGGAVEQITCPPRHVKKKKKKKNVDLNDNGVSPVLK